ncbi:MAG: hypothetical protein DRP52_04370, partial [Planctomycetota bacterium]
MAWDVEPTALGLNTIYMEAVVAEDAGGVEYFFDCNSVSDPNADPNDFDCGWQDDPVYYQGGYDPNTAYQFQVKARDKSENQNETAFSDTKSTTTASGTDTLPPVPNPARWKAAPRRIGGSGTNVIVAMEATAALDEIGGAVEYRFEETSGNPGGGFTSVWQDSPVYMASGLSDVAPGYTYSFQVQVRDANDNPTAWSTPLAEVQLFPPPQVREVPFPYSTIQAAIDAASNGDTVIVHPGTYTGTGNVDLDPNGLKITIQSEDPDEDSIVAATIIDCGGSARAFNFQSGEDANTVVAGFTITNGYAHETDPDGHGLPSFGGAISCVDSSPTIRRCIITDCVADGSGGDGAVGVPDSDPNVSIPGGAGGDANEAGGGGIYCDPNSSPLIEYCSITGCSVLANGGNGGDGESPYDPNSPTDGGVGGDGGAGANTYGGGVYFAAGSGAILSNCIVSNNTVNQGIGGLGGAASTPGTPNTTNGAAFGGGVCHGTPGAATGNIANINDTQVNNNFSDNWGGGLWGAAGCVATLADCQFGNNTAHTDGGGGLGFDANSTAILTDCAVSGNQADSGDGGGIWFNHHGTLTLDNTDITGNSASSTDAAGGGLFAGNTANPLATTVNLQNNSTVSDNTSQFGGGLCLVETNLTVEDSVISGNTGIYGGGAYWYSSIADFHDCTVKDNIVTGDTSSSGAGFYILDSTATIEDVVLTGNEADGFGGAIFFAGPPLVGGSQSIINSLLVKNSAAYDGGAISCNFDASPMVANCTIAQNTVSGTDGSGGGVSCYDAFIEIIDSILWDNLAVWGTQIGIGDPLEFDNPFSTVLLTYSDVADGEEGEDGIFIGDGWGPWLIPSDTNIDEDPQFAVTDLAGLAENYYLSHIDAGQLIDSNCINAGSTTAAAVGMDAYTTRTDHIADSNEVDMGYHYDAAKPHGKVYTLTLIVDRGSEDPNDTQLRGYSEKGLSQFDIKTYDGSGDPTPYEAQVSVSGGTQVSLEALVSDSDYTIKNWHGSDNDDSTDPNNSVRMTADKTVTLELDTTMPMLRTFVVSG